MIDYKSDWSLKSYIKIQRHLAVLCFNQSCPKFITALRVHWAIRHQLFKQSLGTCNVGITLLFWGEVASTDCITVYLGQGVFSSSSGLFTALYLPTGCWHRIVPTERLVTTERHFVLGFTCGCLRKTCRIVALFLDQYWYDPVFENNWGAWSRWKWKFWLHTLPACVQCQGTTQREVSTAFPNTWCLKRCGVFV